MSIFKWKSKLYPQGPTFSAAASNSVLQVRLPAKAGVKTFATHFFIIRKNEGKENYCQKSKADTRRK